MIIIIINNIRIFIRYIFLYLILSIIINFDNNKKRLKNIGRTGSNYFNISEINKLYSYFDTEIRVLEFTKNQG